MAVLAAALARIAAALAPAAAMPLLHAAAGLWVLAFRRLRRRLRIDADQQRTDPDRQPAVRPVSRTACDMHARAPDDQAALGPMTTPLIGSIRTN